MTDNPFPQHPELAPYFNEADHVDIKSFTADVTLADFVAGGLGYQPAWMSGLYGLRALFVRLLGMRQDGIPRPPRWRPADVPMTPGTPAGFFTVAASRPETYWFAHVDDTHLSAYLGVVVTNETAGGQRQFRVITIVHYNNWAGPVYFNVIRPFHHLVVYGMGRAGTRGAPLPAMAREVP